MARLVKGLCLVLIFVFGIIGWLEVGTGFRTRTNSEKSGFTENANFVRVLDVAHDTDFAVDGAYERIGKFPGLLFGGDCNRVALTGGQNEALAWEILSHNPREVPFAARFAPIHIGSYPDDLGGKNADIGEGDPCKSSVIVIFEWTLNESNNYLWPMGGHKVSVRDFPLLLSGMHERASEGSDNKRSGHIPKRSCPRCIAQQSQEEAKDFAFFIFMGILALLLGAYVYKNRIRD